MVRSHDHTLELSIRTVYGLRRTTARMLIIANRDRGEFRNEYPPNFRGSCAAAHMSRMRYRPMGAGPFSRAGDEEIKDMATGEICARIVRALNKRDSTQCNVYIGENNSGYQRYS